MPEYPDYVHKMLARARAEGQWQAAQADAAGICFDVLALFPDCEEAKELVYELFCNEWTIYDNRVAIQRNIDEWDDRPWQQRRRLALSFRFMSRWEGWEREYRKGHKVERDSIPDVAKILEEGKIVCIPILQDSWQVCVLFAGQQRSLDARSTVICRICRFEAAYYWNYQPCNNGNWCSLVTT